MGERWGGSRLFTLWRCRGDWGGRGWGGEEESFEWAVAMAKSLGDMWRGGVEDDAVVIYMLTVLV